MGQTLTHGIYLPDEGERNCYNGLAANWQLLDGAVGTVAEHTTALAGKAPAVHTHTKADITDFPVYGNTAGTICEGNDSRLSDARTPVAHTHTKSDVTDLLNSNFIPSANNSYDLGSSSYQWNNLYAKNYYYNGTAWGLDKNNVWTGKNQFNNHIHPGNVTGVNSCSFAFNATYNTIFLNTRGSDNFPSYGTFLYAGYNQTGSGSPITHGQLQLLRSTDKRGETNNGEIPDTSFVMWRVSPNFLLMDMMQSVRVKNDGSVNQMIPITDSTTDLGTSTNKWKSLNGVNPDALSLPDYNNVLDVTSEIPVASLDGNTQINISDYLPNKTGWLSIVIDDTAGNSIIATQGRSGGSTAYSNSRTFHTGAQSNGFISVFFPILADMNKFVSIKASSLIQMRFYYCLGNV